MNPGEQAIRSLVATWLEAPSRGDLERVLELMADDVVFLGPARPPMRGREAFAAASRGRKGQTTLGHLPGRQHGRSRSAVSPARARDPVPHAGFVRHTPLVRGP